MSLHVLPPSVDLSRRCLVMSRGTVHTTDLDQRFKYDMSSATYASCLVSRYKRQRQQDEQRHDNGTHCLFKATM